MRTTSASFQDAFVDALYGREPQDSRVVALLDQPGFAVYRNTVFQGCVDALAANFPVVVRLVGSDWFRAAATEYVALSPPTDTRLLCYGQTFPDFLAVFEPARSLSYLADVARLDYFWLEAHAALDAGHVTVTDLTAYPPQRLEKATLRVHPSARWRWFTDQPAYTIWRANREHVDVPDDLVWAGEGALLVRPLSQVVWQPLSIGACAFLDACAAERDFEGAAKWALEREPDIDLSQCVSSLLAVGAFAGIKD
ncbi:MAG TPA: DNA-binding domain-containing protein [Dyella sp.]|uniref:DNA-binding domain-containing protein n=1 Tax=Dyella sp. TaxID=1869338 RepID=UPI002C7D621E|nr:DNA-binding domain-containing protein [Dyella sp.]HUB91047.1 DNA-binding domain-containing protein [Dyella sp.]